MELKLLIVIIYLILKHLTAKTIINSNQWEDTEIYNLKVN